MFIWSRNAQVNFLGNLLLNRSDKPDKGNVVNQALPSSWRCSWFPGNVRSFRKKYFNYFIKYELFQVTEACALVDDFKSLSRGDMTNVGEKGSKLSGGQKARISLGKNKLNKIINNKKPQTWNYHLDTFTGKFISWVLGVFLAWFIVSMIYRILNSI